ncbi:arginine--tRNA ligase [Helicobacter pametensis]|uniref:arginine--tRNA ligase n=1 Tax=Helicobacter pametensis TaxID=95149 RepID=UPI0004B49626|nr:arginine--tRNA ligase [Helicobacter pametensis]
MLYLKVKYELDKILACDVVLERPKNKDFGHFATPIAFVLAKVERKNPKILSEEIAEKLRGLALFEKVETLNGYINLTLSQDLISSALEAMLAGSYQEMLPSKGKRILLEYVSANPTGPLHIGHARGAVYGDALLRLGRFVGYDIQSEYYINDAGAQISMLGLSILLAGKEMILHIPVEYPDQYYRGEYIVDLARRAFAELGESVFVSEDIERLAEFGKNLMLEEIKSNLSSAGIEFDSYVSEKSLYARWEKVLESLKGNQGIYESEEKLWLNSTKYRDEKDRVVVRENGEPTYLAGDIIYHQDKFLRHFDHYINIWGADHHGYIARVKSAIEFLGFDSRQLEVLLSQMVKLLKNGEPYKMSKRAGNFILMQDVIQEIGADALRFVFLSKTPDVGLEFDISDLQKQDSSNPIFYIHYANSRIHTLIEKSGKSLEEVMLAPVDHLSPELAHLIFLASQVSSIALSAFEDRSPLKMCDFLKYLASEVHTFYNATKVLGDSHQDLILKVLLCVSMSLEKGLELLGIKAQRKM